VSANGQIKFCLQLTMDVEAELRKDRDQTDPINEEPQGELAKLQFFPLSARGFQFLYVSCSSKSSRSVVERHFQVWLILVARLIALLNFGSCGELAEQASVMHIQPRFPAIR
jgi:hypothetical protein